jgi:hypothetical protein
MRSLLPRSTPGSPSASSSGGTKAAPSRKSVNLASLHLKDNALMSLLARVGKEDEKKAAGGVAAETMSDREVSGNPTGQSRSLSPPRRLLPSGPASPTVSPPATTHKPPQTNAVPLMHPDKKNEELGSAGAKSSFHLSDFQLRYLIHAVTMLLGIFVAQRMEGAAGLVGALLILFVIDRASLLIRSKESAQAQAAALAAATAEATAAKKKKAAESNAHELNQMRQEYLLSQARVELLDERLVDGESVAYRISINWEDDKWDVWHRFSEFEALREQVKRLRAKRGVEWHIPTITMGTMRISSGIRAALDPDFLAKRKDKLRAFVSALILNVHIAELPEVRRFFNLPPISAEGLARAMREGSRAQYSAQRRASGGYLPSFSAADIPIFGSILTTVGLVSAAPEEKHEAAEEENKEEVELGPFDDQPAVIRTSFVDAGPGNDFKLRGRTYLDDKVKVAAGPAHMELIHADVYKLTSNTYHIASVGLCRRRLERFEQSCADEGKEVPFLFLLNVMIPGDPPVSIVAWWALWPESASKKHDPSFVNLLSQFASVPGSGYQGLERVQQSEQVATPSNGEELEEGQLPANDFRNERFKLIPSIVDGPFIVKKAVGNKPALLGKKLTQRYFRGRNYVEVDVDVSSSVVAFNIVSLCRGYARQLVVDMGICFEGREESELPEGVLGVVRLTRVDMEQAEPLEAP